MAVEPRGSAAAQPDADDVGHRLVERLAEQHRLRLDTADAVAEHAEAVDHRRVGVGPDDRVREGDPPAVAVLAVGDDRRDELEVDLVDDPGAGRHDAEVAERRLGPAQELVALAVAVVLALDVEGERARRPEPVDLDRVIDDEIGGDERVDPAGSPPRSAIASRITARSTTAGTPVKSWRSTRDGMNGISASAATPGRHDARVCTSSAVTTPRPALRSRFSSRILTVTGAERRSIWSATASSR